MIIKLSIAVKDDKYIVKVKGPKLNAVLEFKDHWNFITEAVNKITAKIIYGEDGKILGHSEITLKCYFEWIRCVPSNNKKLKTVIDIPDVPSMCQSVSITAMQAEEILSSFTSSKKLFLPYSHQERI